MWVDYKGPDTNNEKVKMKSVEDNGKGVQGWNLKLYRARYWIRRIPDMKTLRFLGEATVPEINVPLENRAGAFATYITGTCQKCAMGHYCPGAFPTRRWQPVANLYRCPGTTYTTTRTATSTNDCNECRPG